MRERYSWSSILLCSGVVVLIVAALISPESGRAAAHGHGDRVRPAANLGMPEPDARGRYGAWPAAIADRITRRQLEQRLDAEDAERARRRALVEFERQAEDRAAADFARAARLRGDPAPPRPQLSARYPIEVGPRLWRVPGARATTAEFSPEERRSLARALLVRAEQALLQAEVEAFARRQGARIGGGDSGVNARRQRALEDALRAEQEARRQQERLESIRRGFQKPR